MKNSIAKQVLETILSAGDETPSDYTMTELKDFLTDLQNDLYYNSGKDFSFDLDNSEFRIIHDDVIDDIWTESLIEQIKDCYDLSDVPGVLVIDWEETAKNCKYDGLGHHFSGYDGNEYLVNGWNIFRTN